MSGLGEFLPDARVLLFAYGAVQLASGTALLVPPRSPVDDRFIRYWPLLAVHLLISSAGAFWAAVSSIPSETAAPGPFALAALSYLPLFEFGRRLIASRLSLPRATRWSLPLLLAVVVGVAALSDNRLAAVSSLMGHLIRFPGGLMAAIGFIAVSRDPGFNARFARLCIAASVTTLLWSVASGLIRPETSFFHVRWLNETNFREIIGAPVIAFRLLLATATVALVVAIGRSIGSHRLALLQESEAHYRAMAESASDAIITADSAGHIVGWNQAAVSIFGYTKDEIDGQSLTLLMPHRFHEPHLAGLHRIQSGGEAHVFGRIVELKGRRKDTSEFPLELSLAKWESDQGWFATAIVRDITERILAQEKLLLQGAALNAAANAMIITDHNGTIEWVNAAFTVDTGYTAQEAVGTNPRDLVGSGVHDQAFFKELWDTILAGNVWHGELTNRRKDGSLYPEEQTITPVKDASGEITHFIAIQRNITGQKRLEAQFLQAQKMESVGRLAGGIAHDFNNLLTVILGRVDLALMNRHEEDPLYAGLTEVRKAGERAAGLTRQLLAFSRKQVPQPRILNLNTVVQDMLSMLNRLLGEDVKIAFVPGEDVGCVKADLGQIEQVVLNLAVNARDAMPTGGTLTIETQGIVLDEAYAAEHPSARPGPHVMLAVSDTGIGMDEAIRLQIFEPFFTTKAPGKGTGLGLSTVYGIVKQSGGSIWVYSEVGRGSVFKIYLPLADGPVQSRGEVPAVAATGGSETILVVEDDDALRRLAICLLEPAGYTVLAVANGEEAMLLIERHDGPIHLMLTDVVMPGMSVWSLVQRASTRHPGMKVVYTSGYTNDVIGHHGVLHEGTHFIAKPYTAAGLRRQVREVLDSHDSHPTTP